MAELKVMQSAPSESTLRNLVDSGLEDVAQQAIDKHKLPYLIITERWKENELGEKFLEGSPEYTLYETPFKEKRILRSTYSPGELFLKRFITFEQETVQMKQDATKIAKTEHEVLIIGDSGVGKELIAKSMIADRKGAIKCVNCAGFPRDLLEAELFGYVQGAFTGAHRNTDGLIATATDGVMFMDEIGELPLDMQAKLLRVLQEKVVRKVGSKIEDKINCKFVFASNRNIREMVMKGEFRKDLYARISTLELFIKGLRPDRACDIVPITESLKGGKEFLLKYRDDLEKGILDLSLNVRSIQQYVVRYNVLGRIV